MLVRSFLWSDFACGLLVFIERSRYDLMHSASTIKARPVRWSWVLFILFLLSNADMASALVVRAG